MDLNELLSAFSLNPAALLVVVFGLVEFSKQYGLDGKRLQALSMALGVALAALYRLAMLYPALQAWVELLFFGLVVGIAASGTYDFINARWPRQEDAK